jgi:hypothetical protein
LSALCQGVKTKFTEKANGVLGEVEKTGWMLGFSKSGGWNQIWHGIGDLDLGPGPGEIWEKFHDSEPRSENILHAAETAFVLPKLDRWYKRFKVRTYAIRSFIMAIHLTALTLAQIHRLLALADRVASKVGGQGVLQQRISL